MTAVFCLRLAWGMAAALLLLSPAQVNPRFFRIQFLIILGLTAAATLFLHESAEVSLWLWLTLINGMVIALVGSVVWTLDGAPAGSALVVLAACVLTAALILTGNAVYQEGEPAYLLAGSISSAFLLGVATTAMLMGHSYLIAPSMSTAPLLRLLSALFVTVVVRASISGVSVWWWTTEQSLATLNTVTLLLPVRWLLAFALPLALGWMAWQATRIRSTQSATGILYAVVFCSYAGELTSQLLTSTTGLPL
jgi:hypothetical protein